MVPPGTLEELRRCFDEYRQYRLSTRRYKGQMAEVTFDITTADTFVAGIASKLLDGSPLNDIEKDLLGRPLLDGSSWILDSGEKVDLRSHVEVHEYAAALDRLREICRAAVLRPGSSI